MATNQESAGKDRRPRELVFDALSLGNAFVPVTAAGVAYLTVVQDHIAFPAYFKIIRVQTSAGSVVGLASMQITVGFGTPSGTTQNNTYGAPGSTKRGFYQPGQTESTVGGDAALMCIATAGQSLFSAAVNLQSGANITQCFLPDAPDAIYPGGPNAIPLTLRLQNTATGTAVNNLKVTLLVKAYDVLPWDDQTRAGSSNTFNLLKDF